MSFASLLLTSFLSLSTQFTTQLEPHPQMVVLSNLIIASLGSSYASGPGIAPQLDPTDAGRSGNNYAHLLTEKVTGSTLTDLSVAGATLSHILNSSQTAGDTTFPPQIEGLPADADLVLVLGGGNDIGYVRGLDTDSNTNVDVDSLASLYGTVLDGLHEKAPNAHIIAVTYLTILGADVIPQGEEGANVAFNATRVAYHQGVAEKLRQATENAIAERKAWAEILDLTGPSWTHGVGSAEPWANARNGDPRNHPRAEGHVAVADLLYKRLQSKAGKGPRRRSTGSWTL